MNFIQLYKNNYKIDKKIDLHFLAILVQTTHIYNYSELQLLRTTPIQQ
jgi:hypothetical protein